MVKSFDKNVLEIFDKNVVEVFDKNVFEIFDKNVVEVFDKNVFEVLLWEGKSKKKHFAYQTEIQNLFTIL